METALDHKNNNSVTNKWFQDRIWAYSGNKLIIKEEDGNVTTSTTDDESNVPTTTTTLPPTTLSSSIYIPTSTEDVAEILRSTTSTTTDDDDDDDPSLKPVACVCGGHEGSNASLFASKDAIILDFSKMKDITISGRLVTVQAGVVTKELVSSLKERRFALPIGTGPDVGVVGYIVNGGLSGYFSRRLGLLGQRVTKFTFVTADGDIIKDVAKECNRELFMSVLGAGSSLGVITEITLELADASILQTATQIVVGFESDKEGQQFAREALQFLQTTVLPNPNASMEIVYTAGNAIVITFVFYDSYQDDPNEWIKQIKSIANNDIMPSLSIVAETTWHTWHETATALWPVINDIKGNPRSMLQHSVGTKSIPSNTVLDFLVDTWIGKAPIVDSSIVECRTLGGAILEKDPIPTGNANHTFFADTIVIFDAANKTSSEIRDISNQFEDVVDQANAAVDGLDVDISGTHSQGDSTRSVVDPSVIFGSNEFSKMIASTKLRMDPNNRFRFHPYWKFLPSK